MKNKKSRFVVCAYCKKEFEDKLNFKCRPRKYCSKNCSAKAISHLGGAARKRMGLSGNKNPNWKKGISKDKYRYKKIAMARWPLHDKARRLLKKAVESGNKDKPNVCTCCGFKTDNKSLIHGHHIDYSKPLDVIWLCRSCHIKLHKNKETPLIIPPKKKNGD